MLKPNSNIMRFGTTISTKLFIMIMIVIIIPLVLYAIYLDAGGNWIFFLLLIVFGYAVLYLLNGLFYNLEFNMQNHSLNLSSLFKNKSITPSDLRSWGTFRTWGGTKFGPMRSEVLLFEFKNGDKFTFPFSYTFNVKNKELKELFFEVLESKPKDYGFLGYLDCIKKFGFKYLFLF